MHWILCIIHSVYIHTNQSNLKGVFIEIPDSEDSMSNHCPPVLQSLQSICTYIIMGTYVWYILKFEHIYIGSGRRWYVGTVRGNNNKNPIKRVNIVYWFKKYKINKYSI